MNKIYFLYPGIRWDKPTTGGLFYNFIMIGALKKQYGDGVVVSLDLVGDGKKKLWGIQRISSNVRYLMFFLGKRFDKTDVVLLDSRANSLLLLPLLFLRYCSSIKIGIVVHHINYHLSKRQGIKGFIERYSEKMCICCASFIITNSRSTEKGILKLVSGSLSEKVPIAIVSPGAQVGSMLIEPEKSVKSIVADTKLLYVGSCSDQRKGLDFFVRAVAGLSPSNVKVFFVGGYDKTSTHYKHLSRIIHDNNLAEDIKFLGRVSDNELQSLYRRADIFVFPSLWEGYGIVLAEAMSHGLPVISTNVSSIPEIVKDRENGILVAPGSVEELTEALAELIGNENLRNQMGRKSLELAKRFKSWDDVGNVLVNKIESYCLKEPCRSN